MPPSAESAREAIVRTIIALERASLDADAALVDRRWSDVEAAFAVQARLTAELEVLFEAAPEFAPACDGKVARRIGGIVAFRADQLRRLRALRDDASARLKAIAQVNAFAKSFGPRRQAPHVLDAQY